MVLVVEMQRYGWNVETTNHLFSMFGTKLYFISCKAVAAVAAVAVAAVAAVAGSGSNNISLLTCILDISTRASDGIFLLLCLKDSQVHYTSDVILFLCLKDSQAHYANWRDGAAEWKMKHKLMFCTRQELPQFWSAQNKYKNAK